jgi:hypothetical protein
LNLAQEIESKGTSLIVVNPRSNTMTDTNHVPAKHPLAAPAGETREEFNARTTADVTDPEENNEADFADLLSELKKQTQAMNRVANNLEIVRLPLEAVVRENVAMREMLRDLLKRPLFFRYDHGSFWSNVTALGWWVLRGMIYVLAAFGMSQILASIPAIQVLVSTAAQAFSR